jgi:NADPH:quinone reductase-like Zn-dependent oxidoreductase
LERRKIVRAVVIDRFGPPEVLVIREVPMPEPGPGDVLVQTKSIGLNFADVLARLGYYPGVPKPPFIPGIELSGTVVKAGELVRGLRKGERVIAITKQHAYAEFVAVPQNRIVRIPRRMGFNEAAAFAVTGLTAYHGMVTLAHAKRGERMLLHAAAGGVGTAALQLARQLGVKVYATVGSQSKVELVRSLGAVSVINYRDEDFSVALRREMAPHSIDIVFDSVGGRAFRKGWRLLAPMGRYVLYGLSSIADRRVVKKLKALRELAAVPLIFPPTLVSKNVSLMAFNLYFLMDRGAYLQRAMRYLLRLSGQRRFRPIIGAEYPFEKIVEAHYHLQSRKSVGKVVLTVGTSGK